MADIKVKGLAELHQALQGLPGNIERNVLRGALRAAGNVIAAAARANVDRLAHPTGVLKKSIRVSMRVRSRAGWVNANVKAGDKVAYYAHMVEFGTARHWIKPKNRKSLFFAGLAREVVDHPGARARPFLRPAFDSQAATAMEAMADYIRNRLPKEIRKAGP